MEILYYRDSGVADTIEKIKDELNGLQDKTGIPIKLILNIVVFLLLPGKATETKLGKLGLDKGHIGCR